MRRATYIWVALTSVVCLIVVDQRCVNMTPRPPKADTPPRILYREEPIYSEEARLVRIDSSVSVSAVVNTAGHLQDLRITRSAGFGLDEAALVACRRWRYNPGKCKGTPVPVRTMLTLIFKMPEPRVPTARLSFDLPHDARRPVLEDGSLSGLDLPSTILEVQFDVDQHGRVSRTDGAASLLSQWVTRWRFKPATIRNRPIKTTGQLTVAWVK